MRLGLACALAFVLVAAPAHALEADTWVAASGATDANPRTQALPCLTITYAASQTQENGHVHIGPGHYQEDVVLPDWRAWR